MYQRFKTDNDTDKFAKAGCDQCSLCTKFCPRYLLGQPVRPETAMRNRMFTRENQPMIFPGNVSCCECNLCTMYACPEGLDPRGATVIEKRLSREQNLRWTGNDIAVHPMYEYRKVPTLKLKQRLDVLKFSDEGPLTALTFEPRLVCTPLGEHAGGKTEPVVRSGESVKKYDLIAKAGGKISSNVHASITGTVRKVSTGHIHIERA